MPGSSAISPTAHYTGYVWYRHGLSHKGLVTGPGRLLYRVVAGFEAAYTHMGRHPGLEAMLLARHRSLDLLLRRAIEAGSISQVLEVAAGMSARGWRFSSRYGARLRYIEADLPAMAERKRTALARAGLFGRDHEVVAIDALAASGPLSVDALGARFDRQRGTAIITEGLLAYLDLGAVRAIWKRFAGFLARFPVGLYLANLSPQALADTWATRTFRALLQSFVRGRVSLHFADAAAAEQALRADGFKACRLLSPESLVGDAGKPHQILLAEAWS